MLALAHAQQPGEALHDARLTGAVASCITDSSSACSAGELALHSPFAHHDDPVRRAPGSPAGRSTRRGRRRRRAALLRTISWISSLAPTSTPLVGSSSRNTRGLMPSQRRQHDFLLVAAAQPVGRRLDAGRLDLPVRTSSLLNARSSTGRMSTDRLDRRARQHQVVAQREVEEERLTLAILGHERDARARGAENAAAGQARLADEHVAAIGGVQIRRSSRAAPIGRSRPGRRRPTISPRWTSRLTSSTAGARVRPRTRSTGSVVAAPECAGRAGGRGRPWRGRWLLVLRLAVRVRAWGSAVRRFRFVVRGSSSQFAVRFDASRRSSVPRGRTCRRTGRRAARSCGRTDGRPPGAGATRRGSSRLGGAGRRARETDDRPRRRSAPSSARRARGPGSRTRGLGRPARAGRAPRTGDSICASGASDRCRRASRSRVRWRISRSSRTPPRPVSSRPAKMLPRDGQVGERHHLLIDHADPVRERVARAREGQAPVVQPDLAAIRRDDAGENLEERRLAGAVLAHQGVRLAGAHGKADAAERPHGAE